MKLDDLYEDEWAKHLKNYYTRTLSFICDGKSVMLMPIHLKIPKKRKFYSKSDKKFMYLGPTWTMYLVSDKQDEQGRVLVFAPYLFHQGQLFLVPSDLIIKLGYN